MKLIYEATGEEVKVGDRVILRGQEYARVVITAIERPRHPASSGRIYVAPSKEKAFEAQGYFPSVFGAKWIEREDQR